MCYNVTVNNHNYAQMEGLNMESKIKSAIAYVRGHIGRGADTTEVKNDAANIFAASYAEYMIIWEAILNL